MKRGWYLWDWWQTGTIKFDPDIKFYDEEHANDQRAFRQFNQCKKHGVADLEDEIERLQERLATLKKLEREEVLKGEKNER